MITYRGQRNRISIDVWVIYAPGRREALPPRHDLANHSPDGFNWGYGGSGPAQLALALLAHHYLHYLGLDRHEQPTADTLAIEHYQDFKWRVIAHFEDDTWELTSHEIADELHAIKCAAARGGRR